MTKSYGDDDDLDRGTRCLVDDLLLKPQSYARDELLHRARRYRYHDYKSEDAMVSVTLVKHLKGAGFRDLAQNAADGKYDQQKDASDEWAQTPEGKEMMDMVEGDPKLKAKADEAMRAIGQAREEGRIPRYVVPDDGPPEPGKKGQA